MINFVVPFISDTKTLLREQLFEKSLNSLNQQESKIKYRVCIGHYSSNMDWSILKRLKFEVVIVNITHRFFNMGKAINMIVGRCVFPGQIISVIGSDFLVPTNYTELIESNCNTKKAFFPVCYSLNENKPPKIKGNQVVGAYVLL
jgi:hypothetical protein